MAYFKNRSSLSLNCKALTSHNTVDQQIWNTQFKIVLNVLTAKHISRTFLLSLSLMKRTTTASTSKFSSKASCPFQISSTRGKSNAAKQAKNFGMLPA